MGVTDKPITFKNTLVKRIDFSKELNQLRLNDPALGKALCKLDTILENLLHNAREYDRVLNSKSDNVKASEWEVRLMRCRYVLGFD